MGVGHADEPVAVRVRQLEERVLAAGLATDAELDRMLAGLYAHATPLNGARIVARAWADPGYAGRLLADGNAAAAELGFDTAHAGSGYRLKAVANTPGTHNMIVCTLCSCYPVSLLGPSPSWYKSFAYRSRAVREPRAVLAEFGLLLPPIPRSWCGTRAPRTVTWSCPPGPRVPRTWPRRIWLPWSPGTG